MADKKPFEGFGRGGRGASLMAALQGQLRRPGQAAPSENVPQATAAAARTEPSPEQPRPIGRGMLFQQMIAQVAAASSESDTRPPQQQQQQQGLAVTGRGAALFGRGRATFFQPPSETASAPSVSSEKTSELLQSVTSELEELSVQQYKGTSGITVPIAVNYVKLRTPHGKGIYEYHVSFIPPVDSKHMKFRLMGDQAVRDVTGSVKTFDGAKLYLPFALKNSPVEIPVQRHTDGAIIKVCIKLVKKSSTKDLIHLYNLLFGKVMRVLKMTRVGRNYFDPRGGIQVPQHRLEIWPGYVTAVQEYEGGVMLNCDVSSRVLRTVTAFDIMSEAHQQRGNVKDTIERNLVGCIVLTRYNNKTYHVDDVAWDMNPMSTFPTHDGGEISFVDYYMKSYDIQIRDLEQPLLVNKPKKKDVSERMICLVPELCFMTGLTDDMRNDFKVMKDVASHTRVTPERRQMSLQKFIDNINGLPEAKKVLENWNLELDNSLVILDGRQLNPEDIIFGNGAVKGTIEADWGRQATNSKVLVAVDLEEWAIVYPKKDNAKVVDFIKMFNNVCPAMGIKVRQPIMTVVHNDRTDSYCNALKEVINRNLQLVVIIFPSSRDDRYSAVKKLCCIDMAIPSQVINLRTISDHRKLRSVSQKIALQINCKLGGELWSVKVPLQNIMICGVDTYHDSSRGKRSVLAFVASTNADLSRWFSVAKFQNPNQELGDSLKMLFLSALRKYYEINHKLPERVCLFRDGVSDGQMSYVTNHEVPQFESCFKHFDQNYSPAFTVVIVQKRINTRMYALRSGRAENPPPGSILDHTITRKNWYDFFLISQHVRQGTVTPTHYVVVQDSSTMKPEHVQRLSYKMTHMYYNWPGTIRVPAPCQYAHKLAYLVGQNLHKEANPILADRLFYL